MQSGELMAVGKNIRDSASSFKLQARPPFSLDPKKIEVESEATGRDRATEWLSKNDLICDMLQLSMLRS